MAYVFGRAIQLDDGTWAIIPAPPASTSAADWVLVDTDGVLTWQLSSAADFDSIVTDGGAVVVDDVTGNVVTEG